MGLARLHKTSDGILFLISVFAVCAFLHIRVIIYPAAPLPPPSSSFSVSVLRIVPTQCLEVRYHGIEVSI